MAKIEDLVEDISDEKLRAKVAEEVKTLKLSKRFGLVFEEHVPETVALARLPILPGLIVQDRTVPEDRTEYQVLRVDSGDAVLALKGTAEPNCTVDVRKLLVIKRFQDTVYPGLVPAGEVRGNKNNPAHVVLNSENFHALQLLSLTYGGKADCIYIDPPYNTGDKSWKYNNRFVDENDSYRHSKWLSFLEKRLRLAHSLLKRDSVLIVTIDEHEVHHLGVLLEELFPNAYRQLVTIVNNPKGVTQPRFSRVEEYAHFVFFGEAGVSSCPDDLLSWGGEEAIGSGESPRWKGLLRSGTNALPSDRPNMVYPIAIDPASGRIVGAGETIKERSDREDITPEEYDILEPDFSLEIDGSPVAWPIRRNGKLGNWGLGRETLLELAGQGVVKVGSYDENRRTWAISYLTAKLRSQLESGLLDIVDRDPETGVLDVRYIDVRDRRIKTVWHRSGHDAGTGGADLVAAHLGARKFDFPKSVYAVFDTLNAVVGAQKDALVIDFFAGSGTTLHAVAMLNSSDGGNRRCVLVTNNELTDQEASRLAKDGVFKGDPKYEAKGIFEAVTKPRCTAAVTGARPDGDPVQGKYLNGYLPDYPYSKGFDENISFRHLDYLDPDSVELGRQYDAIAPLLWMTAGSVGHWEPWDKVKVWSLPKKSTYGVLFDESQIVEFATHVNDHPKSTHLWLVTNSHTAFTEMRSLLPTNLDIRQLYRDYLRNFRIDAPGYLRK